MSFLKKVGIMALALTMAIGAAACSDKVTISADIAEDKEATPERKIYMIATNTSSPPFEYKNFLDEYVGIDIDILQRIAENQGFTYELVPMSISEALQELATDQVDGAMAGIFITEERKELFDYSEPYLADGIVLAVDASRMDIKGYENLAGKTVAVTRGTVAEEFAESIKDKYGFRVVSFDQYTDTYKDVLKGNSQALLEDNIVVGFLIAEGLALKVVSGVEERNFYGFAVPKGKNPELLEMFNRGLEELKESGEYQKILKTYIQ